MQISKSHFFSADPTPEPYSVIASKELGLCDTMLDKSIHPHNEHKQPGGSAEGSGKVWAGGGDVWASTQPKRRSENKAKYTA
jgi:hypothetical protein